jgi:hypothetical protein
MPSCKSLIVIAGFPCVGKSRLQERLFTGGVPEVERAFDVQPTALRCNAAELLRSPTIQAEQLIVHFDLSEHQWRPEHLLGELKIEAERTAVVTVVARTSELRRRHNRRLARFIASLRYRRTWKTGRVWHRCLRHSKLWYLYRCPGALQDLHRRWEETVACHTDTHWMVDCSERNIRVCAVRGSAL